MQSMPAALTPNSKERMDTFEIPWYLKAFALHSELFICVDENLIEQCQPEAVETLELNFNSNTVLEDLLNQYYDLRLQKKDRGKVGIRSIITERNIDRIHKIAQLTPAGERVRQFEELNICYGRALRHWSLWLIDEYKTAFLEADLKLINGFRRQCRNKSAPISALQYIYKKVVTLIDCSKKLNGSSFEFVPDSSFIIQHYRKERNALAKFIETHAQMYAQAGKFSRSEFSQLVLNEKIICYDDLLKYVTRKPYSRAARLFVTIEPIDKFAAFIQQYLAQCYLQSYTKKKYIFHDEFLQKIVADEIINLDEIDKFMQEHPGSPVAHMIAKENTQNIDRNAAEPVSAEHAFLVKFTKVHLDIYLSSGLATRSPFTKLFDQGKITEFNDIVRYVAANPHSRAGQLFVKMTMPPGNKFAEFIRKHIQNCHNSFTSCVGSLFTNTSRLLKSVGKGEITNYQEVETFAQEHPGSRTAKLLR